MVDLSPAATFSWTEGSPPHTGLAVSPNREDSAAVSKGGEIMTDRKIWFITGAGRGMGVDFARAALAAGQAVVATGRNTDVVTKALGAADDLLVVKLDITSQVDALLAVQAAVDRFGRIDVLVNNAANFYAGYFEELTPEQ